MSQMQPEPADPSEVPAEQTSVSPEPVVPPPSSEGAAPEPASVSAETAVPPPPPLSEAAAVPVTPPPVTPSPAPVAAPPPQPGMVPPAAKGPDWFTLSQDWMAKSQEITARLLYDAGGWVFGGLLLAALMLLQTLVGLGFADGSILIAGLALAIALPFNLAGLGIIRYFNTLNQAADAAKQELGQNPNLDAATLVKLTEESNAFSPERRAVMDSSLSLALYLSVIFTLIGAFFALWHLSWAVALLFLLACAGGLILLLRVIRSS